MAEDQVLTSRVTAPPVDQPGLSAKDLHALIAAFAPIVRFHPEEQYMMCSVEAFLQHARLHDKAGGGDIDHPAVDQLPTGAVNDGRYWMILEDDFKPGDLTTAKAYVRALWQPENSYTDLQFWFLYAYNGPGRAHLNGLSFGKVLHSGDVDLAPLGEHYGDWECCMIRIDNAGRTILAAWLSQHAAGRMIFWPIFNQLGQTDGHIHVYASHNGHAHYAAPGANPSELRTFGLMPAAVEFYLRNDAADGGQALACADHYEIVSADWLGDAFPEPKWLDYPYRWGPEGTATQMDPERVRDLLSAGLGWFGLSLPGEAALELAGSILSDYVTDDLNGPTGPKMKAIWNGAYPL